MKECELCPAKIWDYRKNLCERCKTLKRPKSYPRKSLASRRWWNMVRKLQGDK